MAKKSKVNSKKINHKNVLYVIGAVIVIVLLFTLVLKYTGKELAGKATAIYAKDAEGKDTLPVTITFAQGETETIFEYANNQYVLSIGNIVNNVLENLGIESIGICTPDSNDPTLKLCPTGYLCDHGKCVVETSPEPTVPETPQTCIVDEPCLLDQTNWIYGICQSDGSCGKCTNLPDNCQQGFFCDTTDTFCKMVTCGDNICSGEETTTCPNDCEVLPSDLEVTAIDYSPDNDVYNPDMYAYIITLKNNGGLLNVPQTTSDTDKLIMKIFLYNEVDNKGNIQLETELVLNNDGFSLSADGTYIYIAYLPASDVNSVSEPQLAHLAVIIDTIDVVKESNEDNNDLWFNPFQ